MSIVVFFDLGDTLVIAQQSDDGSLLSLNVLPFVPDVLEKLKRTKVNEVKLRLGVISNTGKETLARMRSVMAEARLLDFFDPALLLLSSVEGIDKRQKQFFERAVQQSGTRPEQCIYVGEDEAERRTAESAKLRTSYHPLHVFHVIDLIAQGH
jgi:FMN phosphatase YigB (HAD superfamily)